MIRICTKLLRFAVSVPRIDLTPNQITKDHKIDFYPIVGIKQRKLGACIFNQPANQNLLTEQFIDQLYRFLVSYQYDNTVENIWIESKDSVFTHGVDYKRLVDDKNYLQKVYKLAIYFANFNKPSFAQVAGGVKGAGAYLLSLINMPLGYKNVYMSLDQVSRGLIPLMGGSHRLARMPMHLGYYLALVGDEFNAQQMAQIGLLKGSIPFGVSNSQIRQKFHEANLYFRQKFRYMDFDDNQAKLKAEQQQNYYKQQEKFNQQLKFFQAELLAQSPRNISLKFAVNQHLAARIDYQNATNPYNSFSEKESGRTINNYYQMRLQRPLQYLFEHKVVNPFNIDGIQLNRLDLGRIDYIFGKRTLIQVLEALKQENTQWANKAYDKITKSDPLAALLTFELIKQAESSSWIACVQREYAVAKKLLEISTLKLKTKKKSSEYVFTNTYSNKQISQIQKSIVRGFFINKTELYQLRHEVKQNSLIPACDYYKDVPDSVRAYLNQTQFVDKHYTEQKYQIKRFLQQNQINYKSKVYDVNILRQKVYQKLQTVKFKELQQKRLAYLANHDRNLQIYQNMRINHLQSINNQKLQKMIDKNLRQIFRARFENRYSDFEKKTAKLIGLESKLQFFKNIKNIILDNLLYKGYQYQTDKKGKAEFNGIIYFDPKGKDIYNSTNTYLQQDPVMKQLASDFSKGTKISKSINQNTSKPLPKFFATANETTNREAQNKKMEQIIKDRYNETPEIWAQAYTYKELIQQASMTSEQLAGYLEWNYQNFHDLLSYTEHGRETYGEYVVDMVEEVKKMKNQKIEKLKEVKKQLHNTNIISINSKFYQFKNEQKVRKAFPFYYDESTVPSQFRRSFLSVLDSTLSQFTQIYNQKNKDKLLVNQELGALDRWINHDLTAEYTQFLKNDVQYVSSYLMILFVKDMLCDMTLHRLYDNTVQETIDLCRQKYNVNFSNKQNLQQINKSLIQFLYFLVDMHTNSKAHIQSPQSKLIDFINRLKTSYEFNQDRSLPYSFEGLLLLIGKDRKKVFDTLLGQNYIAEPQFLLEYITRQARKTSEDINKMDQYQTDYPSANNALKTHFNQHFNSISKSKHLVQNYFYYMMLFEKHIHQLCGKQNFIPDNFVNAEHQNFNKYCKGVISSDKNEVWLQREIKGVIEQILIERFEVEPNLTKGELLLYDQNFSKQLQPQTFKKLIKEKLNEQVFLVKNLFQDKRQYEFERTQEQNSDLQYTKAKRTIKNAEALKKLNNLTISEQVYLEYMSEFNHKDDLSRLEKKFVEEQREFFKNGLASRLPFKSYHRMARDIFVYPQDMVKGPENQRDLDLYKKTNINFKRALSGEKIQLSSFSEQYKQLKKRQKDQILQQMVSKISMIESL